MPLIIFGLITDMSLIGKRIEAVLKFNDLVFLKKYIIDKDSLFQNFSSGKTDFFVEYENKKNNLIQYSYSNQICCFLSIYIDKNNNIRTFLTLKTNIYF